MTAIAATVQAFFTERLQSQRQASPRTITAYRDTIRNAAGIHQLADRKTVPSTCRR